MSTLLIILLGTMLIQGSSLASPAHVNPVRGDLRLDFAGARHTLLTLTLASLWGWTCRTTLTQLQADWLLTPTVLAGTALIVALTYRVLKHRDDRQVDLSVELSTHGASLGIALFCATTVLTWSEALSCGVGSALALVGLSGCFNALRDRMTLTPIPLGFRGIPVALITAGFMALALMGFAGMVRS